ncbi:MAG: response regulator [Gammaproteobacteria bacterium]|nr:response regulator [Gammaproteobacteria bacterium]
MQGHNPATPPLGAQAKSLRESRILVFERSSADGQSMLALLQGADYANAQGCSDPHAAADIYAQQPVHLVLLELDDVDGLQVLERLKAATPADDYLSVLVVTGNVDRELRLRALQAGAGDVLTKPFDREELLYRVRNLLRTHVLHARLAEQIALDRQTEARLRDSEERFKLAMRAADEGIWDWNIRTGSVFMSPRWKALLGYRDDELPSTLEAWTSRVHPEDLSQAMADLEAYMDGNLSTYDKSIRVRHRDGDYRWIKNRWMAVRDESGLAARIVGTADDITEDVHLRDELEHARQRAEMANRAKSEFLANMSHEIRTPLTAIIGFAEAGMDQTQQSSAERSEGLRAIIDNGRHLRSLIDDILDISKIEADRLEIEAVTVNLVDMISSCHSGVRAPADAKGLVFEVHLMPPLPRTIETDPTRLKQILYNLCNNAVKFTEKGSVRLIVSCDPPLEHLVFTVVDQGIGMTPEQLERVFEPFVQADTSTTRQFGGTGLGLSISRRLAQRLGGEIEVVSEPGVGSVFVLTTATGPLPEDNLVRDPGALAPEPCQATSSTEIPSVSGHILLAEDNPYNQKLIGMYTRKTGAEVTVVENGEQAVEEALCGNYDLILMDLQMPVMGGLEAVEMLRQTLYEGPIVALTAHSMIGDREKVLNAGCTDFLTKPVDWQALFKVIAQYLPVASERRSASDDAADDDALRVLVVRFVNQLPSTLQDVIGAADAGDWDTVRSLAHQLKGVAGGLGFPQLTDLGAEIERAVMQGADTATVHTLLETLKTTCEQVAREFHAASGGG